MKLLSIIYSCVFFLVLHDAFSQETDKTRIYETRSNIAAYPCNVVGTPIYADSRFNRPPYRARFALVRMMPDVGDGPKAVVRFLTWYKSDKKSDSTRSNKKDSVDYQRSGRRTNAQLRQEFNAPINIYRDDKSLNPTLLDSFSAVQGSRLSAEKLTFNPYFLISKFDLDSNCVKVFDTWWSSATFTLGVVTMPMKIRLGKNFDFQGNLSLGTTAGVKIRISKYYPNYLNILAGLSLATVSLDSFSTSGKISGQPLTNIAVFSPSLGAVVDFGRAQVGAFIGMDFLNKSTQEKYSWIYDKKPWLSVGFGFSIFSVDSKVGRSDGIKQLNDDKPLSP